MNVRNPQSGVTLLETMVALLIMAMVAMLLSSALGGTARTFNRGGGVSVSIDQALARRELRQWVEHALITSVPGDTRDLFQGTASGFALLTLPPSGAFWPGAATLIETSPSPSVSAEGLLPETRAKGIVQVTIAPPDTQLSYRYWGSTTANAPPGWHDRWPAGAGLPGLIRIDFSGPQRPLPPMVIRPGKAWLQSEMSLSSLVPPALPSRP